MGAIEAVFFDMDGTLIDSEGNTGLAIEEHLAARGIERGELDLRSFHGLTWREVEQRLLEAWPQLGAEPVARLLAGRFHELFLERFPPPLPGAVDAFTAAARRFPTGVVSSSDRITVEHVLEQLGLSQLCQLTVCAEDFGRSKPDPECYRLAARRIGCEPAACLVFEDSLAGLRAAHGAGAQVIAIARDLHGAAREAGLRLAYRAIDDYTELEPGFFDTLA